MPKEKSAGVNGMMAKGQPGLTDVNNDSNNIN